MQHRCGLYRAKVVAVNDPAVQGRIQVTCPQLWGESRTEWISPHLPSAVPDLGQTVVLGFEAGDEDHPIWFGRPV
jgi:hypothetical protein